jgi:WhiB family redox-sensing transcriptional regulator
MDWRDRAVCRDEDPELFFPIGQTGPALAQIADAKLVCRHCPVIADCLAFALDNHIKHGVYGGLDETERDALNRERRGNPAHSDRRTAACA